MATDLGNTNVKQRVRLHRVNPEVIQKNLENMVPYIETKHFAQARYYGAGKSPLKRTVDSEFPKQPVHERLGLKRHPLPIGIQSNMIMPKNRWQRQQRQPNNLRNFRNQKFNRVFSVQNRIRRIRNNQNVNNFKQQGNNNLNRQQQQKVRLHRSTPMNYQVQVTNDAAIANPKHSISRNLHPVMQQEIQLIQSQKPSRIKHEFDDTPMLVHATGIPTHERFTKVCA